MTSWVWSGRTALLWGIGLFWVIFVPVVVRQYRRYGDWNVRRLIGTAAATVYVVAIATYTWLPLPPRSQDYCHRVRVRPMLQPGHSLADVQAVAERVGPTALLAHPVLLQVVFNVVLFVPLGVLVRRYLDRGFLTTVVAGFAASLLVETTQLTGLWFFYPCAYRTFDVDDLITNTLGALLGALLAPLLLGWMPRARLLEAARLEPRPVTAVRRWTGQVLDLLLLNLLMVGGVAGVRSTAMLVGGRDARAVWVEVAVGLVLPWLVVFVVPPWRHLAASPGQSLVWLRDGVPTHGRWWRRMLRANITGLPWVVMAVWDAFSPRGVLEQGVWTLLMLIVVASVPFTRGRRGLTCALTGAEMWDIRALPSDD